MPSSPILRPIGGIYGWFQKLGVTITPAALVANVAWAFAGPVTFSKAVTMSLSATLAGKEIPRIHQVAMAAVGTAGGIAAFQNPLSVPILVESITLEWTTQSSGACTVSAGVAADGTTLNAGLISGQSVASAAGSVKSTVPKRVDENGGTNDWVTVSVASGTVTGLVGRVYINYYPIQ